MTLRHSSKADIVDWSISWYVAVPESSSSCLTFAEEKSSRRLEPDPSIAVVYKILVAVFNYRIHWKFSKVFDNVVAVMISIHLAARKFACSFAACRRHALNLFRQQLGSARTIHH
jgi:hypothetical protein